MSAACERCGLVDTADEWADYYTQFDLPVIPDAAASPFCPNCAANREEVMILTELISIITDLRRLSGRHDLYEPALERVEGRMHDLLMAQRAEADDDAA